MSRVTTVQLRKMKEAGEKITVLTAYDYSMARLLDEAGIDVLLVGDSLGQVVLGYDSTIPVSMEDMIHHSRAVARGARRAMVVADMPFLSYQVSVEDCLYNAGRLLKEGGAHAVKLEGGREIVDRVKALVAAGIPVMGHLGLLPQAVHVTGGYRVQGRDEDSARRIVEDARLLEEAGAFSLVLECVPASVAAEIARAVSIPVIGIGAGAGCDGQVLVTYDLLGLFSDFTPRFVKRYADLRPLVLDALRRFKEEVREGIFPGPEHSF
ncbi:MAG: 3-methyl-2-oxobutanoate hydroxymethyltransferase [Eubacteriales bacterium]|nr:3-methyl-2-oxobutanoate hydroxymethyltransferase [Eubacteriales bacterium]MDN5362996.1 3-methyl-2-oxobutanoate hydroxymethyltransferase [Eubacteriales bacterium]